MTTITDSHGVRHLYLQEYTLKHIDVLILGEGIWVFFSGDFRKFTPWKYPSTLLSGSGAKKKHTRDSRLST